MIQRIQSIYLFLGVISLGVLFLSSMSFGISTEEISSSTMLADADLDINDHPALIGFSIAGALMYLISIFMFKNRTLQTNLVKLGLLLTLLLLGFAAFQFGSLQNVAEAANAVLSPSFGWAGPFVGLLFGFLAIRSISKDEKLVQSMDRLR